MPGFDGTGPVGAGPMTGRGAGRCAAGRQYGYLGRGYCGQGFGRGFRRGAGRGFGAQFAAMPPASSKQALQESIEIMEADLGAMRARLEELNSATPDA